MWPFTGSESPPLSGFVQCWWKRTVLPVLLQSTTASTGLRGPQLQVVAHTSMMPGAPLHRKRTAKQHVVGIGVPATADTQTMPTHPGGTGFGAGVRSVLTSVALKPGH